MFSKKSFTFAFVAFAVTAFAFNPLAFFNGLNLALDLQGNKIVNKCLSRLSMNENVRVDKNDFACFDTLEIYAETFFANAHADTEGQTSSELTLRALDSAVQTLDNLGNDNNFKAGQGVAETFKDFAATFEMIVHERYSSSNQIHINATAVLFGLTDQLQLSTDEGLTDCLADSNQIDALARALAITLEHKQFANSFQDIVSIIKYFPGFKSTCATVLQGVANVVTPLEKAYKSDPKAFYHDVKANIEGNAFSVGYDALELVEELKSGNDYKAGVSLGKLLQGLFQGIAN